MKVFCFTRTPKEDAIYATKLAYSMHLVLQKENGEFLNLNHNSGILYAKATQNEDGTLNAMNLKNPWIFLMEDGRFGVLAQRILPDGQEDVSSKGKLLFFTSNDLIHYIEQPLLDLETAETIEDAMCTYCGKKKIYLLMWKDKNGNYFIKETKALDASLRMQETQELEPGSFEKMMTARCAVPAECELPEGAVMRNWLEIPEEIAAGLQLRFTTPENVANEVPERITASSLKELQAVKAVAKYSDGSNVEKRVDWYTEKIDWNTPGEYVVDGCIHQNRYEFPVAWHKADPCIGKWKGKYYFISTNDLDREHTIYMREGNSIPDLVTARQVKVLDAYTYSHLVDLLWAPELHVINDKLYVFHAGTAEGFFQEQCHVMALKEGGNPMKASDWEMPVRVVKKMKAIYMGKKALRWI